METHADMKMQPQKQMKREWKIQKMPFFPHSVENSTDSTYFVCRVCFHAETIRMYRSTIFSISRYLPYHDLQPNFNEFRINDRQTPI